MTAMVQVLAMVKSHYPWVDIQWFEEGFAVDIDEDKFDSLMLEVTLTAELLVENIVL